MGAEYDFFTGEGVRMLCTLLWLEVVPTENADRDDDDDELDDPKDTFDVPETGRANILGRPVTGVLGAVCDPVVDPLAPCVVSSIK